MRSSPHCGCTGRRTSIHRGRNFFRECRRRIDDDNWERSARLPKRSAVLSLLGRTGSTAEAKTFIKKKNQARAPHSLR